MKIKELFKITSEARMMKYYIREYERLMKYRFNACSKASGIIVEQSFTILDMNGVGMSMLTGKIKDFIKIASNIGQNYYPEMLGQMFMINTSTMFSFIFAMIKGFIDEKTRNKMSVFKDVYKEKLLEYIEPENLPDFLGGTCTCNHIKGGCMYADIGPWNPKGGIES